MFGKKKNQMKGDKKAVEPNNKKIRQIHLYSYKFKYILSKYNYMNKYSIDR